MAFKLRQENYGKPATSEQRKVLDLFGTSVTGLTRIQAHLKIREMLQGYPQLKRRLVVWRRAREQDRERRREEHAQTRGAVPVQRASRPA